MTTSFEQYRRLEEAAWRIHQRMRAALIASGAKEVAPDCFESSAVDYADTEQRIMEAMREQEEKRS
jgi:1-deoxy-D-xylulose 5-phosphate reductoisomerase